MPKKKSVSATAPKRAKLEKAPEKSTQNDSSKPGVKLGAEFYQQSCEDLAKALLGKLLVSTHQGVTSGVIVETEAYLGVEDKAAHSYNNKQTDRNRAMFMDPGTAYVYNIYGMYCCVNVSSEGDGCAVLIRALEPLTGQDEMCTRRSAKKKPGAPKLKTKEFTNGPSKLTQALAINKDNTNRIDLISSTKVWIEDIGQDIQDQEIVACKRINIDYAEDWTDKPLRFYKLGNVNVSVKNKIAEKLLAESKAG